MFTSPIELALDNETGHAEYAGSFCELTDCIEFYPPRTARKSAETGPVGVDFR